MPIEQRVVSGNAPAGQTTRITPRQRVPEQPVEPEPQPRKTSIKMLLISSLLILVLVLGAGYWFILRPTQLENAPDPVAQPGLIHTVESVNVNLAQGHYLRLGFAVQLTDEAEEVDGAQILDAAISLYSGQDYNEVLDPDVREALKQQLAAQLDRLYDGQVMEVYFTDYVAQ